ncbi:MAG: hypothetical protein AABN95_25970 [Acidobacteriota bacterium]
MSKSAITKIGRLLAFAALFAVSYSSAAAQTSQASQTLPTPVPPTPADQRNETRMFATMEEEMRAKRDIQSADKAYRDNLNRARDLASLCVVFKEKKHLDRDDLKKLDKAEKLAKGIRDAVGGSSEEVQLEKRPADLAAALTQLVELAESLRHKVEKTPKRVVSAAVINEANVLLELIHIIRGMQPKT